MKRLKGTQTEVETIVRGLQKQIIGKRIVGVRVILPKIVGGNAEDFRLFSLFLQ